MPQTAWVSSRELESVGGQDARVRISLQTEGLRSSVTHGWATPAKMRKKCSYGQKNFGSICSSLSPPPTHLSATTNINPFENKVWGIYFYKEVCSFVHYCWLCHKHICICMRLYNSWTNLIQRILKRKSFWRDVGAFVSVGVGECWSEYSFVCFGPKPTQKACARDFLRDQKQLREGKVPGSQQKSGKGNDQKKAATKRRVGTCGLRSQVSQRKRMGQRSWWLCGNFTRIHARDNLFVHLFFHPLVGWVWCVLCVCKAISNAPGRRWEKPLDDRMTMGWFRRLR